jgi:hypothetical protein
MVGDTAQPKPALPASTWSRPTITSRFDAQNTGIRSPPHAAAARWPGKGLPRPREHRHNNTATHANRLPQGPPVLETPNNSRSTHGFDGGSARSWPPQRGRHPFLQRRPEECPTRVPEKTCAAKRTQTSPSAPGDHGATNSRYPLTSILSGRRACLANLTRLASRAVGPSSARDPSSAQHRILDQCDGKGISPC